jgi:hypothetical protein
MNATVERIAIDESIAPKLREWFTAGRGVRRWTPAELGTNRPDMFTPADVTTPPHWAFPVGSSTVLDPSMIDVETFAERMQFKGRIKRYYWGHGLAEPTEKKAQRLCKDGESFVWEFDGFGLAIVRIGSIVTRQFSA